MFKNFWEISRKTMLMTLLAAAFIIGLAVNSTALSCDVAVVSGKYTTDGKPVLWKNFDCSSDWEQQVKFFPAKNPNAGDYFLLYHHDDYMRLINGSPIMPQSGANEAGLAASVAAVYEDLSPLHESGNLNTDLVQCAVEQCATLEDFENLLKTWPVTHRNRAISANYVVVDAQGGAAMYECYTGQFTYGQLYIQYRKYDANTGQITDDKGRILLNAPANHPGFINRTNLNQFVWYNSGVDRYLRAQVLLTDLAKNKNLNAQTLMQVVSKDVVGKQANNNSDNNYSTTYCISRNQTRSGTVFQGVKAGDDPAKSVFWTALGEPSLAVYVPHMIGAKAVTEYAYMDKIDKDGVMSDVSDNSLLTIASDKLEIAAGIHSSNRGSVLTGPYNKYIDKTALAKVQQWTFPLENIVIGKTNDFIRSLDKDPALLTQENLWAFTSCCGEFVYNNYTAASADAIPWAFGLPGEPKLEEGELTETEEGPLTENDPGMDPNGDPAAGADADNNSEPAVPSPDTGTTEGSAGGDDADNNDNESAANDLDPDTGTTEDPAGDISTDPSDDTSADPAGDREEGDNDPGSGTEIPDEPPADEPPSDITDPADDDSDPSANTSVDPTEDTPDPIDGEGNPIADEPEPEAGNAAAEPVKDTSVKAYDKSVLRAMIMTSMINITTATISTDGSKLTASELWVTLSERNAYQNAINRATLVSQNLNATQAEVDQAVIDLQKADQAYARAKKPGTKRGMTLNGQVLHKQRLYKPRHAVEGARIYFRSKGMLYETYSDVNGNFKLETDAAAGFYTVYCTHPQYGQLIKLQYIGPLAYGEFLYIR